MPYINEDLEKKMVLLAGPRQCGKTTLAKALAKVHSSRKGKSYYNWDIDSDRHLLKKSQLDPDAKLWIFDEVHKNRQWRNWLKGIYDGFFPDHQILVTGSARLDLLSRGGDSLQGRYINWHLHPLSLSELLGGNPLDIDLNLSQSPTQSAYSTLDKLFEFGNFPEPFLSQSSRESSRWRLNYSQKILRDEILSVEQIIHIDKIETLFEALSTRVGSPLSINSLREDVEVSFKTIKNWIGVLERLYAVFRIYPYGPERIKAVKKESKLYMWDWRRIEDPAIRLENMVACHLLKVCDWIQDYHGEKAELRFFRSEKGQEVDFIVLRKSKPWIAVEVKSLGKDLSPSFRYLLERMKVPHAFQVSMDRQIDYEISISKEQKVRLTHVARLLMHLV